MRLTVLFIIVGVSGLLFIGALGLQMQEAEPVASSNNESQTYNQSEEIYETGIGIGSKIWPLLLIIAAIISAMFVLWSAAAGGGR